MHQDDDRRARVLAVLSLSVVPWTIVLIGRHVTLVTASGLVDPSGPHVTLLPAYLAATGSGPPPFLLAWPIGVGIYALALGSLTIEMLGWGDRRVSAGLLVLVGVTQLSVSWGFLQRGGYFVVPLATLLTWTIAWWFYWADLLAIVGTEQ